MSGQRSSAAEREVREGRVARETMQQIGYRWREGIEVEHRNAD